jgi:hypothetical protein
MLFRRLEHLFVLVDVSDRAPEFQREEETYWTTIASAALAAAAGAGTGTSASRHVDWVCLLGGCLKNGLCVCIEAS